MPKVKYTEDTLLESIIEIAETEGFETLTARKIANKAGCSVAPIYTVFGSIAGAIECARKAAIAQVIRSTEEAYTHNIFLNMGVGLLVFAREHKGLYRELFMTNPEDQLIKHFHELSVEKLGKTELKNFFTDEELGVLHSKMWIFTQGIASMICSNQLDDLSNEFFIETQREIGGQLMTATLYEKGVFIDCEKENRDDENCAARWNLW